VSASTDAAVFRREASALSRLVRKRLRSASPAKNDASDLKFDVCVVFPASEEKLCEEATAEALLSEEQAITGNPGRSCDWKIG
jgi:tRNA A37 threonylcarbamoyladenosine dehydratase